MASSSWDRIFDLPDSILLDTSIPSVNHCGCFCCLCYCLFLRPTLFSITHKRVLWMQAALHFPVGQRPQPRSAFGLCPIPSPPPFFCFVSGRRQRVVSPCTMPPRLVVDDSVMKNTSPSLQNIIKRCQCRPSGGSPTLVKNVSRVQAQICVYCLAPFFTYVLGWPSLGSKHQVLQILSMGSAFASSYNTNFNHLFLEASQLPNRIRRTLQDNLAL